MTGPGDHDPDMRPTPLLDDETIEALVHGDPVPDEHAPLAAFASRVRAAGDRPPPPPSATLARLFADGDAAVTRSLSLNGAKAPADVTALVRRPPAPRPRTVAKVAGLGLAAKIAIGVSAAAAGVVGAGAAGVLPGSVDRAVRDAIEAVTPFGLSDQDVSPGSGGDVDPDGTGPQGTGPQGTGQGGDGPTRFGTEVSRDATGESDGEPGVDGGDVSDDTPGASNRPPGVPESPGDPGAPGPPDDTPGATAGSGTHPTPPVTTGSSGSIPDERGDQSDGQAASTSTTVPTVLSSASSTTP